MAQKFIALGAVFAWVAFSMVWGTRPKRQEKTRAQWRLWEEQERVKNEANGRL